MCSSKKHFFWITGCGRMEYWQSEHPLRHGGTWMWHYHRRCKHSLPLLWDVEDNICLAYRGHGSLQYQLLAFWGAKILVSGRVLIDSGYVPLPSLRHHCTTSGLPNSVAHFPLFSLSYSAFESSFTFFHAGLLGRPNSWLSRKAAELGRLDITSKNRFQHLGLLGN